MLRLMLAVLPVLIIASTLTAQASFSGFDDAVKAAKSSNKPVFLVVIATGPRYPDQVYDDLAKRAETDEDAKAFELARVNIASITPTQSGKGRVNYDEAAVERFGGQGACSVYAPGATKAMWADPAGASKANVFKLALEAYKGWHDPVEALEKAMKDDRDLRKNAVALHKLAEAWAKGLVSEPALKNLDAAIKAVKKESKTDERIELWSMRAAEIALACGDNPEALRRYTLFKREYKDSARAEMVQVGIAKAHLAAQDYKAALAAAEAVSDDASGDVKTEAAGVISKAQKALEE
jgi:tetratricopeptide (TPR) repeat protein